MNIGTLTGYLRLDDTLFAKALTKNQRSITDFARKATAALGGIIAPAAMLGGFAALTRGALAYAQQANDSAEATGLSIAQYQALDRMLRQNGASGEQLATVLTKLRGAVADAANGSKSARENFGRLGLHFSELVHLSPAELLATVAAAMHRAGDGTLAFSAGADLLGSKNLPRLNASLKQLATDGLPAVLDQFKGVPEQYVRNVDELAQATENLGIRSKQAATYGLGALLQRLKELKAWGDSRTWLESWDQYSNGLSGAAGAALMRTQALNAEIAEERRLLREANAENERRLRIEQSLARVGRYGTARGAGRNGAISPSLLDRAEAAQRKARQKAERADMEAQLDLVRKAQDAFERGIAFQAANDPLTEYAEKIRAANDALKTGLVDATAYGNALRDAARAFGSAQLDRLEQKGSLLGTAGFTRREGEIQRALARARRSAAQGNYGDAQDQIDRINELDPTRGMALDEAIGRSAMPDAKKVAATNDSKAKTLETQIEGLVLQIKNIADKLTVS